MFRPNRPTMSSLNKEQAVLIAPFESKKIVLPNGAYRFRVFNPVPSSALNDQHYKSPLITLLGRDYEIYSCICHLASANAGNHSLMLHASIYLGPMGVPLSFSGVKALEASYLSIGKRILSDLRLRFFDVTFDDIDTGARQL